jgi:hypothetical protein
MNGGGRSFPWFRGIVTTVAVAVSGFFFVGGGFEFDSTIPGLGLTLLPFVLYLTLYRTPFIGYVVGALLITILTALIIYLWTAEPSPGGLFAILMYLVIALPAVLIGAVVDLLLRRGVAT